MAKPLTYTPHSHDGEPGQGAPQATSAASLPLMRFLGGAICCGRTVARDKQAGDPSITLAIAPSNSVLTLKPEVLFRETVCVVEEEASIDVSGPRKG